MLHCCKADLQEILYIRDRDKEVIENRKLMFVSLAIPTVKTIHFLAVKEYPLKKNNGPLDCP